MTFCPPARSRHVPSVLAMLLAVAACKDPATQIVVRIDSDLTVPTELARLHAAVYADVRSDAQPSSEETFPLDGESLPVSFGVAPEGDPSGPVVITVDALGPDGRRLFTERAVTAFAEGRTLLLSMELLSSCIDLFPCPQPSHTCREGQCQSEVRPMLSEVAPQREHEGFPRPMRRDAGVPGPTDAGARDASSGFPDASSGFPDASMPGPLTCTDTAQCNGQCPMGSQGCVCADTPNGLRCIASCSAANQTCPVGLRCNVTQEVCTP